MKIEQFRHDGANYEQTDGVSALLPEDKIIELYNLNRETRKPIEIVQLHQTYYSAPVISITTVQPTTTKDDTGRETTQTHTFLISLKELTSELVSALRPFFHGKMEPLEIGNISISTAENRIS